MFFLQSFQFLEDLVDYYEENDLWLLVRRNQLPDGETSTLITTKLVAPQRPIEWTWLAGSLAEMFPPRRNIRTNFLFGFSLTIVSSYSVSNHYYFSFYGSLLFLRSCHRCCPLEHPLALRSDVTFQIWSIHRAKHFAMRDSLVHFLFTGFVCNNEKKKKELATNQMNSTVISVQMIKLLESPEVQRFLFFIPSPLSAFEWDFLILTCWDYINYMKYNVEFSSLFFIVVW